MTLNEKIEEVMEEALRKVQGLRSGAELDDTDIIVIDQAKSAILNAIQEAMPKEKTVEIVIKELGEGYSWGTYSLVNKSFNSALAEMRERLND